MKIVKIKFHVVMILIIRKQYNMNSGYEPVDVVFAFGQHQHNKIKLSCCKTCRDIF